MCVIEINNIDDDKDVQEAHAGSAVKLRVHIRVQFDPAPLADTIFFIPMEAAKQQVCRHSIYRKVF